MKVIEFQMSELDKRNYFSGKDVIIHYVGKI